MRPETPGAMRVVVLASVDPVEREIALTSALLDRPDVVALVHDLGTAEHRTRLRRRVLHGTDVLEDEVVDLEHVCPSCTVREDVVPTIALLAGSGRYAGVVVALPPATELLPVVRDLATHTRPGGALAGVRLAATVALTNATTLSADLLGAHDLAERGLAFGHADGRTVGEALLGQLPVADAVLVADTDRLGADLTDLVRAPDGVRWDGLHWPWLEEALATDHEPLRTERRLHPLTIGPGAGVAGAIDDGHGLRTRSGAWTLDLRSQLPLHPGRLLAHVDELVAGPWALRGRFWVPNRPDSVCALIGAGRQLSVAVSGGWGAHEPDTRVVVVGSGPGRAAVVRLFKQILLTPEEHAAGMLAWLDREDELEPFLGSRSSTYQS